MRTTRHNNAKRSRHGLTLIELLVVVFIILAVSAAVVPVLAPTAAGRRQREAARVVSTFISSARTRAIEIGRPAGIWLEGISDDRASVLSLSYCEVPPPYSGETVNAVMVYDIPSNLGVADNRLIVSDILSAPGGASLAPLGVVRPGDIVRLNNRGGTFLIEDNGSTDTNGFMTDPNVNPWSLAPIGMPVPNVNREGDLIMPSAPDGVPFQIIRQPRKSAASSVELPQGTVIDLFYSGDDLAALLPRAEFSTGERYYSGNDDALADATTVTGGHTRPVIILFGSNGSITGMFRLSVVENPPGSGPYSYAPAAFGDLVWGPEAMTRPLYLLVGKSEKVGVEKNGLADLPLLPSPPANTLDLDDDLIPNLIDPENYWVSISPLNGTVSTDEVATVNIMPATFFELVQQSRSFAIEKLGIGGR